MVDTARVVEIIFNAIDNTGSGLASVNDKLETGIKGISNFTAPLADLAKKAEQAELAVTALGTVFLGFAVKEASDLTKAMRDIGTQINKTSTEDVEGMKVKFQDFAKTSQSSFANLKDATFQAVSSLGDYDKSLAVMGVTEKLAIVGQADLATATKAVTDTMNAYGMSNGTVEESMQGAERVAAAMFTTMQLGVMDMNGLAGSLGRIVSMSSAAKVPIEMVGSALAALTGAGVDVDESVTQLGQLFKQLMDPSEELKTALGGLTITTDGLPAVLNRLKEATGGNADQLVKMFGRMEAARAAMTLINDEAGKFKGTIDLMTDSTKNFNKAYEDVKRSVEGASQMLANNFKVMMQNIGKPLEEGWLEILESMIKVTNGFNVSLEKKSFDPVLNAFKGFEEEIAGYLSKVAAVLPEAMSKIDWSGLISSLGALGTHIGALFGGIDLTTADGLSHAIQFIVNSLESLNRVVSGIIDVWKPVIQSFFHAAESFNALDDSSQLTAGNILGVSQVFESLKGMLLGANDALKTIAQTMQFIGGLQLASMLASASGALSAFTAVLPELVPLAALLVGITAEVLAYYKIHEEKKALEQSIIASTKAYQDGLKELNNSYSEISTRTGVVIKDTADFHKLIDSGTLILDKNTGKWTTANKLMEDVSKSTGIAFKSQDDLNKALENGLVIFDKTTGVYTTYDKQVADLAKKTESATFTNGGWVASVDKVAQSMDLANSKGETLWATWSKQEDAEWSLIRATEAGLQGFIRYEDGQYKVITTGDLVKKKHEEVTKAVEDTSKSNVRGSTEWKNVQDAMLKASEQADNFRLKAAELNEKRYEANLTAVVDLHVKEVEEQTKRIQAAFDSINVGINSTGDTLSSLAESLSKNTDLNNTDFLKNLAKEESQRRDKEFDLQKELIEKQTDYLKAKTQRLQKGDAMIKIEANDLAVPLSALFSEVLKYTQIKASDDGMELLLGIGSD